MNPGHPQVDFYISSQPLERFFDAARATFPVVSGTGLRQLSIAAPWDDDVSIGTRRICAGRIHLYERDGDEHHSFSMGGVLELYPEQDLLHCRLTSTAPIFNLQNDPNSPGLLLAIEFEELLARRDAAWIGDDASFAERLEQTDPLELFVAALTALGTDLHQIPLSLRGSDYYRPISHAVKVTIEFLHETGQWPEVLPILEDII